jgi:hypothetical protein
MTDLFGNPDPEPAPDPYAGLGQDARRTARQRDQIAAGIHPATKLALAGNGRTCGDCAHLVTKPAMGGGPWFKCALQLHDGYGLDIRKKWPACIRWQEVDA